MKTPSQNSTLEQKMQQNNDLEILSEDLLQYGDLLLIANKGLGKTNALMVLCEHLRRLENTRVIIFEDFPKFCLEFNAIGYFRVLDSDVVETNHCVNGNDYFLVHERDYAVRRGSEIRKALEENKDLVFTSEVSDIERQCFFIYSVVNYFYRKAYLRKYKNYHKTERIIFVIEESQNAFDSSTVSKKVFNRLRKIFSVARNLDLHFILASQRLQDLNTKIRGRTRLLIGAVSLDDYELKIRRLLRHSKHVSDVLTLPKGVFLYTALDTLISFPKFEQTSKPHEYRAPHTEQKKLSVIDRLIKRLAPSLYEERKESAETESAETPFMTEEQQEEEDLAEEDLTILGIDENGDC